METNGRKYILLTLAEVGCILSGCMANGLGSTTAATLLLVLAMLVGWLAKNAGDRAYYERMRETAPPAPRTRTREPSNAQPPVYPYRSGPIVEDVPSPTPSRAFELTCRFVMTLALLGSMLHGQLYPTYSWTKLSGAEIADTLKADELARLDRAAKEAEMWRSCGEVIRLNGLLTHERRRERSSGHPEDGRVAALLTEMRDQAAHRCQ